MTAKKWNTYSACAAIEGFDGLEHTEAELVECWQYLIDTNIVWSLQGWYGAVSTRSSMSHGNTKRCAASAHQQPC
jgi:hypothetical protein